MSQLKIVILGSGIGGLTLGRCLHQKGIPAVIYEKASSTRRHSYGITLELRAYNSLLKILDMDEESLRQRIALEDGKNPGMPLRANRNALETLLRESLIVNWDHSLSSATLLNDRDGVELAFQNDVKIRPSPVVDLLGVHSQLRKSLLPQSRLHILPFVVYRGKRQITSQIFKTIYAPSFRDGPLMVFRPTQDGDPRLEISINEHLENGIVNISYIYSRTARSFSVPDPLHNPERYSAEASDTPENFFDEVAAFMEKSAPKQPFCDAFDADKMREDRVLHWLMRTALVSHDDLLSLLKNRVVVLGDSAHTTPILGGQGANIAVTDAIALAGIIEQSLIEKAPLEAFYQKRWPEWNSAVEASKKKIAEMHASGETSL